MFIVLLNFRCKNSATFPFFLFFQTFQNTFWFHEIFWSQISDTTLFLLIITRTSTTHHVQPVFLLWEQLNWQGCEVRILFVISGQFFVTPSRLSCEQQRNTAIALGGTVWRIEPPYILLDSYLSHILPREKLTLFKVRENSISSLVTDQDILLRQSGWKNRVWTFVVELGKVVFLRKSVQRINAPSFFIYLLHRHHNITTARLIVVQRWNRMLMMQICWVLLILHLWCRWISSQRLDWWWQLEVEQWRSERLIFVCFCQWRQCWSLARQNLLFLACYACVLIGDMTLFGVYLLWTIQYDFFLCGNLIGNWLHFFC